MRIRLPRLPVNWREQPSLFERYWDLLCSRVESNLLGSFDTDTLPTAGILGQRALVTDAVAGDFGDPYTGGGTLVLPVFYDGSVWRLG